MHEHRTVVKDDSTCRTPDAQRQSGENLTGQGALADAGIIKIHWECWARCSLACPFCYRSKDSPLITSDAERLLRIVSDAGAREVVFAGGDPSLRDDLGHLLSLAHDLGLHTEVQTNAHSERVEFLRHLERADLVGLSLDGHSAEAHDSFRGRAKNFDRVLRLAERLESRGQPFVVRTVVSAENKQSISDLGQLLTKYEFMRRWALVQFTAVGDGFVNRLRYEIEDEDFHRVAWNALESYQGAADVNVYPNSRKSGIYFIVGPSGDVHGHVDGAAMATYPSAGNILHDQLKDILAGVTISPKAHSSRYRGRLLTGPDDAPVFRSN